MKIISWNVNGLRAVYKRDFLGWLKKHDAEIVCLQEIKCQPEQLAEGIINHDGYHLYFNPAEKPGYSGVAVFTKEKPLNVETSLGLKRFDSEGRILRLDFKDFILINFYLPHGGRKKENLDYKLEVYRKLFEYLKDLGCHSEAKGGRISKDHSKRSLVPRDDRGIILIGDFNIAHTEIDLARPKHNQNNIMFTAEERSQIDKLIELGFADTFREFEKGNGHYTWWPYFANARERNLGWRIDYAFVSNNLKPRLKDGFILTDDKGSDHCPVGIELS